MTLRFSLPYVAIDETLLRPGQIGPALSTYLHELAHMFGGDSSVGFGHALSEMLSRVIIHAGEIAARERLWDGCAADRESHTISLQDQRSRGGYG